MAEATADTPPSATKPGRFAGLGQKILVPALAVFTALVIGGLIIWISGGNPLEAYRGLIEGAFGSPKAISETLIWSTPYIFAGLAVALAFKGGLFNIGAEGQLALGALAAAWLGYGLPKALGTTIPAIIHVPICVLGGALAGGLWGAIPGWLKARFGAHEVINTIMLNFVATALVNYWGHAVFVHETVHTAALPAAAMLPRLDLVWPALRGSPVNASLLLAAAAGVATGLLLWRTPFGYELRAAGLKPGAAEYGGVRVAGVWVKAMALSGALAGLVGANFVLGYKGYFESGFTAGVGFLGIAVALLGRTHPVGIALAALFFGALSQGALVINALVPKELVEILQGIVILVAIVAHEVVERWLRRRA